jgi:hypothetical protein
MSAAWRSRSMDSPCVESCVTPIVHGSQGHFRSLSHTGRYVWHRTDDGRRSADATVMYKSLAGCTDAASLRPALDQLCAEFGKVARIDILTMADAERRRALCFLRLEARAAEQRLMTTLGASRFGEDVLFIVDLPHARVAPGLHQASTQ